MNTSKIPASITLAQGMLESNWGKSDLATLANNHFGIKCGNDWFGETFHHEDDEYKNGKLVNSCFRSYKSSAESFKDHSLFLLKNRYSFLYNYEITDYKSWAKGLSKAGYATDKKYAKKLIFIIEKYGLYEYDTYYTGNNYVAEATTTDNDDSSTKILIVNKCKVAISKQGDTPYKIAKEVGISPYKLLSYNSRRIKSKYQKLDKGTMVYLERKKTKYFGDEMFYITSERESLADISDKFGIKLNTLAKINDAKFHKTFGRGEKIILKREDENTISSKNWVSTANDGKYLFDEPLTPKNIKAKW